MSEVPGLSLSEGCCSSPFPTSSGVETFLMEGETWERLKEKQ